jgi:hypothetical protein
MNLRLITGTLKLHAKEPRSLPAMATTVIGIKWSAQC